MGISNHVSRYPSERLVLTHGEGGAREAIFDLFHKERHVDRPRVGEWVDLAGETRRRRKMAPSSVPKRGATRIKRYKTEVTITREDDRLMISLPENFDMTLIPEGSYRLEAQLAATASFKLIERPRGVPGPARAEGALVEPEAQKELVWLSEQHGGCGRPAAD